MGAIAIGTVAFEVAALMTVMFGRERNQRTTVRQALIFTATKALKIVRVTARLIALSLVTAAPFLLIAGIVYKTFLTEFDINYYLHEKPPVFLVCLGIAGLLILGLAIILIPLLAARSMAFPLVLFEGMGVNQALVNSRQRMAGQRSRITLWLVAWGITNALLSACLSGIVAWFGQALVNPSLESVNVVIAAVGLILALWLAVNFLTTLIANISFAVVLMNLYRRLSMSSEAALPASAISDSRRGQFLLRRTRKTIFAGCVFATFAALGLGAFFFGRLDVDDQAGIMATRAHRPRHRKTP